MARVSYDVDPDPTEPHEVRAIPPQEVHIPEAPKSVLEGGAVGAPTNGFPPAYNPFNDPVPPGTVYGPGDDDYGRKKPLDLGGLQAHAASQFGALLHKPWEPGASPESIIGYWAEDGSPYEVTAPPQLRDMAVRLQNLLCKKYNAVEEIERKLAQAKRELAALFGG